MTPVGQPVGEGGTTETPAAPIMARTRHGDISLDEMAALLPGLGALMPLIAERYVVMYHAAQGGNWPLANYEYLQMAHLFRNGAKTRPKFATRLHDYLQDFGAPLHRAIHARDWQAFAEASGRAVDEANRVHADLKLPYIVFKVPPTAPDHLDLSPHAGGEPGA